jgi:hypothetical protein
MHPRLLEQLAHCHAADLRKQAMRQLAAPRQADAPADAARRVTIRSRAGWALVQIGLRMATSTHY